MSIVVIGLCLQAPAAARPQLYYYDGDAPMITMMLYMMDAMGIIDKLPNRYAGQLYSGSNSPYRNGYSGLSPGLLSSPYGQALARKYPYLFNGLSPGIGSRQGPGGYGWRDRYAGKNYPGYSGYSGYSGYGCGGLSCVQPATLDGIWMNSDGQFIGIKANRMIMSDGDRSYAYGTISLTPRYLYARLNGATTSTPYSYTIAGNQLNLRELDGTVRRFYRLPGSEFTVY